MLPLSHNGDDPNIVPSTSFNDLVAIPKKDQDMLLPFTLIDFPSSPLYIYTEEGDVLFPLPALTDYSFPDNEFDVLEPSKQLCDIDELTTVNDAKEEHCHQETTAKQLVPKKRSSKKKTDRHSKIKTTQGLRDRRVRLSIGVAREFFDLQDMLRFDKASKTIEWLLTQSKSAIKEISNDFNNHDNRKLRGEDSNSLSECNAVNETIDALDDESQREKPEDVYEGPRSQTPLNKARKIRSQASERRISSNHIARESREKARARAKERTREKLLTQELDVPNNGSDHTAEPGEDASRTSQLGRNHINSNLSMQQVQSEVVDRLKQVQAINEETTSEDSLATSTSNNLGIFQENQFRDIESYVMPWDADNEWHFV